MNAWFLLLPVTGAILGWCFVSVAIRLLFHPAHPKKVAGFSFQGIVPKKQPEIASQLGALSASLFSLKEIEEKITHPGNVKKMMPQAEEHIDHFLRVKLVKSMPVVGMFVGDKTIATLKALFVTELEELFPEIMSNYIGRLDEDFNMEELVTRKLSGFSPAAIEKTFLALMKKELLAAKWLGAGMGLIIGLLQLAMMLLLAH